MLKTTAVAAALMMCAQSSIAQELVYTPVNPSFGGNPFNSAHLLALANAQNDFDPPEVEEDPNANFDRFIRSLESRLLSGLSREVTDAIFGENAQESGTIVFGDQTISFENTLDGITLTITNADGTVTVITVPTLLTTNPESAASGILTNQGVLGAGQAPLTGGQTPLTGGDLSDPLPLGIIN